MTQYEKLIQSIQKGIGSSLPHYMVEIVVPKITDALIADDKKGGSKLTKEELSRYYYLDKELRHDYEKIIELETQLTHITQMLSDMPKGRADNNKREEILDELTKRKQLYLDKVVVAEQEKNKILQYINGINDPLTRLIIQYRCIDLLSWTKVAHCVGGNNTSDSVRMMFSRHIQKK